MGLVIGTQTLGDVESTELVEAGNTFMLSVSVGGANNSYQWTFDGAPITGATNPIFETLAIRRATQGIYRCEITNTIVGGVTIASANTNVRGIADISGFARIAGNETGIVDAGTVRLLEVQTDAYDTIADFSLNTGGNYTFEGIFLSDYIILVDPTDRDNLLPSYHEQSIQWDFATVIELDNDTSNIDILVESIPVIEEVGDGSLSGDVFTDFPDDQGRLEARRRVQRVGCALRRRRGQGRGSYFGRVEMDADGFELYSYQSTDDEGRFTFDDLPEGTYRLFIEYPGIPINEESFTEFEVGSNPNQDDFAVTVTVFEDGILIEQLDVVSVEEELPFDLSIYPNPANDALFVNVTLSQANALRIELFDLRGVKILSEELNENSFNNEVARFDVSKLTPGIYLLRISLPDQNRQIFKTSKLIIERN